MNPAYISIAAAILASGMTGACCGLLFLGIFWRFAAMVAATFCVWSIVIYQFAGI